MDRCGEPTTDKMQRDCQGEVRHLFMKLHSWREESQREFSTFMFNTCAEFSNIMNPQGTIICKGIENLVEELSDTKAQLSMITQERNDLLETVESLNVKLHSFSETSPDAKEVLDLCTKEVGGSEVARRDANEQDEEGSIISNGTMDSDVNEETVTHQPPIQNTDGFNAPSKPFRKQRRFLKRNQYRKWKHREAHLVKLLPNHKSPATHQPYRQPITIPLTDHNDDQPCEIKGSDQLKVTKPKSIEEYEKTTSNKQFEDIQANWMTPLNSQDNMAKKKLLCGGKISDPTCRQPNGISCPYRTDSASHMKEHVEAVHEKIKNHFCKECDYTSYRNMVARW